LSLFFARAGKLNLFSFIDRGGKTGGLSWPHPRFACPDDVYSYGSIGG
jgi:hypothetical protein